MTSRGSRRGDLKAEGKQQHYRQNHLFIESHYRGIGSSGHRCFGKSQTTRHSLTQKIRKKRALKTLRSEGRSCERSCNCGSACGLRKSSRADPSALRAHTFPIPTLALQNGAPRPPHHARETEKPRVPGTPAHARSLNGF